MSIQREAVFENGVLKFDVAADVSQQFGLLANDALTIVLMRKHGYSQLASADSDFDAVPGLTRFSPI
jgi:predicted nucleic acid-binding protein